jgi:flavin-dependent dehydrogenase
LFDAQPDARDLGRIETLQARLKPLLAEIGALERIEAAGATAVPATASQWFGPSEQEWPSILDPHGPPLHIDRRTFRSILAALAADAGVHLFVNERMRAGRGRCGWQLALGSDVIESPFLIVATGRGAVPITAHVGRRSVDRLVAVLASARNVKSDHDARLIVEAAVDGWWYRCPSGDGRHQIVFLSDADLVREIARSSVDWFARRAVTTGLGRDYVIGEAVRIVAADTYCRNAVVGDDVLLIGDAATAGDPLAGQGLTWALTSARGAAAIVFSRHRKAALTAYSEEVLARFVEFLTHRYLIYSRVTLWPNSTFWLRRQCQFAIHNLVSQTSAKTMKSR